MLPSETVNTKNMYYKEKTMQKSMHLKHCLVNNCPANMLCEMSAPPPAQADFIRKGREKTYT